MGRVIFIKDLECFNNISDAKKNNPIMCPERGFDLDRLPTDSLKDEMDRFIRDRGRKCSPLTMRSELTAFNWFCDFMKSYYPDATTLSELEIDELINNAKKWLAKTGKAISWLKRDKRSGKNVTVESDLLTYIRKVYLYANPVDKHFNYDADRWYLDGFPIPLKKNLTKRTDSISFEKIKQVEMRKEIKKVIFYEMERVAVGTVQAEITAINMLSDFLSTRFPQIQSLKEIDRDVIEEYLIYINTEGCRRKSYAKVLQHIKSLLKSAAIVLEDSFLSNLMCNEDIPPTVAPAVKVYSDSEMEQLKRVIAKLGKQEQRAIALLQLLGLRASDVLSLKQDSMKVDGSGKPFIEVLQTKTGRICTKYITEKVCLLFRKACECTNESYGRSEYVFVDDNHPNEPMQYSHLYNQLKSAINSTGLPDGPNGELRILMHNFRRQYATELANLGYSDEDIANALGQARTGSVHRYRKSNQAKMAKEVEPVLQAREELLKKFISKWGSEVLSERG